MNKKTKHILLLWLAVFMSTFIVWLPFIKSNNMQKVFANYDGPDYIRIAQCGYDLNCIRTKFSSALPLEYYPAHFPAYPLLIKFFNISLPGWWAMLIATLFSTCFMITGFYLLLEHLKIKHRLWLSLILLFFPGRNLILHSIGAPETLFIGAILFSIYFYLKQKYLFSGLFLALTQATKTPAILLFIAFCIDVLIHQYKDKKRDFVKYWPLLLGPAIIIPIFYLFRLQTNNFWAYFNSGDNFHLFFPPFQVFNDQRSWLGDFWLEEIIYIYLIGGIAISELIKKHKTTIVTLFPIIFYTTTLFIAHRDISRYSAPLYPFWIIAFAKSLNKKNTKIIFAILLPAVYLYAINFIKHNIAPIADWTPYY